jgi:hypothetical protein
MLINLHIQVIIWPNKNESEGVTVTQENVSVYQFTTYFGPNRPSSGDF